MATRVFIVDDHPLVREWLANLLRSEPGLSVAGEADDSPSAISAMTSDPPDVAVIDLKLHRGSGLDLIKGLRDRLPALPVIVLSMHEEITDVERAFRAGAMGYVTKREGTRLIIEAIRTVCSGKIFASQEVLTGLALRVAGRMQPQAGMDNLSDRELEVFRRLGEGQSTREISELFGVSQKTVQTYCARIKEKLGLQDWNELSRFAHLHHHRS
jgi:DNA-binding NarL/FixJ family response regulator